MIRPAAAVLALLLAPAAVPAQAAPVPTCMYRVDTSFPHDPTAFTEGLFYSNGMLYESTGREGASRIVVRTLEDAKPVTEAQIDPALFGEGIIDWKDQIISLTWRGGQGFRWDRKTLKQIGTFSYEGEGWGMTRNGDVVYQSDGSSSLRLRDPATMRQTGSLAVTADGKPVDNLNELEWIEGEIWANVWLTDRIARIDPATGHVKAWVDFSGLRRGDGAYGMDAVLNGIAWDAKKKRIFVTGKNWNGIYQITPVCP